MERTNTTATLKMFNVSKDKKTEFDVADYAVVRDRLYPVEQSGEEEKFYTPGKEDTKVGDTSKTAALLELPFTRHLERNATVTFQGLATEKVAEKRSTLVKDLVVARSEEAGLLQKKMACELEIHAGIEELVSAFSAYQSPDFSKFACEAYSLHGAKTSSLLTAIGKELHATVALEKVAGVINNTSSEHTLLVGVLEKIAELIDTKKAHQVAKEKRDSLEQEILTYGTH